VCRDWAESAGYKQYGNAAAMQFRQYFFEFTIAYQRVAADERNVQRAIFVNQAKGAFNQGAAFEVRQLSKGDTGKT
jgi:hypothetical protein